MKFKDILREIVLESVEPFSNDEFISRSHNVHDKKRELLGKGPYDYSNTLYVKNKMPVEIICHEKDENGVEHGPFLQRADGHLAGRGCMKCSRESSKSNTEEFINKSQKKFDKIRELDNKTPYDYSKVKYTHVKTPVEIICHEKDENGVEHGSFMITPSNHLNGSKGGCPKCQHDYIKDNDSNFIEKAKEVNDSKRILLGKSPYDYSKVKYVGSKIPVEIICHEKDEDGKEHGIFLKKPNSHLSGFGCPKCSLMQKKTTEKFISLAKGVHDKKRMANEKSPYDYSETNFVNNNTPVLIICHEKYGDGSEHGFFLQKPKTHLYGSGCPVCNELKGETDIKILLNNNNIKYNPQHRFNDCKSVKKNKNKKCRLLSFDFYLPDYKTLIEFDGAYHFKKHYSSRNDSFITQVLNDREKNRYAKDNGYKLIRISYFDAKNIGEEIRNGLLSKDQLYLSTNYNKHKTGWVDENLQPTTKFMKKYLE